MKVNTLFRDPAAVDGGSVATQPGGNGPSGTLSIDTEVDNGDASLNIQDADAIIEDDLPDEVESPIKDKIETKGKDKKAVAKEPVEGEVPDTDDLEAFPKKDANKDKAKKALTGEDEVDKEKAKADAEKVKVDDKKKEGRDYSIFPPEVAEVAKKLPNIVYATFKDQVDKYKALESQHNELKTKYDDASKGIVKLPDSYIEHPQAYVFDPQYSTLRANKNLALKQADHYLKQLAAIEGGGEFVDITGLDKDGNFIYTKYPNDQVTFEDKENIRQKISELRSEANQNEQQINTLRTDHATKYKTLTANIDQRLKSTMPWLADNPEAKKLYTETKIPYYNEAKKDFDEVTLKDVKESADKELAQAGLGKNPLAPVVSQLRVAVAMLSAKAMALEDKKQVKQQIDVDKSAAEPLVNSKGGKPASVKNDKVIPTLDGMDD